jgi:hypothetical protein
MGREDLSTGRTRRRSAVRQVATPTLLLFFAGVTAAACGGASSGVASVGTSTATTAPSSAAGSSGAPPSPKLQKAQLAYSVCIRAHGVANFPDPLTGGGYPDGYMRQIDPNGSAYDSATKECASLADAADMAPYTKAQMAAHIAAMLKIAECMRDHGIAGFPDPDAEGGFKAPVGGSSSSIDFSSSQYAAAAKACNGPPGAPKGAGSGGNVRQGG